MVGVGKNLFGDVSCLVPSVCVWSHLTIAFLFGFLVALEELFGS